MKESIFKNFHVLVIGDVMLDKYIFGSAHRISPEAPVPVVHVSRYDSRLGGAANVALNIATLGAQASLIGVVGKDDAAYEIESLASKYNIKNYCIPIGSRPTTVKTRVIAASQHMLRIDQESVEDIAAESTSLLLHKIKEIIAKGKVDYVILQDYNKGFFNSYNIPKIITLLQDEKIKYAVDPKFDNATLFQNADIFKPNLKEAYRMVHQGNLKNKDLASSIKDMMQCETVVLTLSEDGLFSLDQNESHHVPTVSRDIVDVCGAGDTVISMLVLARLKGYKLYDQARLANAAAGVVCQKNGVVPISFMEIKTYF